MTRVVGVGVIGMGWMGTVHSRSYLHVAERFRDERVQPRLIVCADDVEERAKEGRVTIRLPAAHGPLAGGHRRP